MEARWVRVAARLEPEGAAASVAGDPFFLSTLETMVRWAERNSLWPATFGLA